MSGDMPNMRSWWEEGQLYGMEVHIITTFDAEIVACNGRNVYQLPSCTVKL